MKRMLVTGGMGFIGSNFIRYMIEKYDRNMEIVNLDLLTYAGNPDNVSDLTGHPGYRFVHGDIADAQLLDRLLTEGIDTIVHFAAESHVDRSIARPETFLQTNVMGTFALLEAARKHGVRLFVHISTDEVYGSLGAKGAFTERTSAQPNSPYSASKAASDFLVRAYHRTYGLPAIITRCSNNYGPYQHPEKLIPTAIIRSLRGKNIPIYGNGHHIRDWLHVEDHCSAIDAVIRLGCPGEVYNIGGGNERTNVEIAAMILSELGLPGSRIEFVADRPGHDRRYAINSRKLRKETGWHPSYELAGGIRHTVRWYTDHRAWWEKQLPGEAL